jgi:hypothetical protein
MSNTATPAPAPVHARTPRSVGLVEVADHVGQLAAEAVSAVRRAGLRPGLERSFGHGPELTGHVVAQQPPAGEELARNGVLTLCVAAPDPGTDRQGDEDTQPPPDAEPVEESRRAASLTPTAGLRGRKLGLRAEPHRVFDPPPPPTLPNATQHGSGVAAGIAGEDGITDSAQYEASGQPQPEPQADPTEESELLLVRAAELFAAARTDRDSDRPAHERAGAAGGARAVLDWGARHRALSASVCAAVVIWAAVALVGPHVHAAHSAGAHPGRSRRLGAGLPARRREPPARKLAPGRHDRRRRRAAAPKVPRPAPAAAARTPTPPTAVQPAQPPQTTQPAAGGETAAPEQAAPPPAPSNTGGGPFSP